jgi:hypothetical protein
MKDLLKISTLLVIALTTLQGFVPQMPFTGANTAGYVSAGLLFAVLVCTAFKQFADSEIHNASFGPTLVIALVAVTGGLNDLFKVVPLDAHTAQWLRLGLTILAALLHVSSSTLFPSATACIAFAMLCIGLSGCGVVGAVRSDCRVLHSGRDTTQLFEICLQCNTALPGDVYDSVKVTLKKK